MESVAPLLLLLLLLLHRHRHHQHYFYHGQFQRQQDYLSVRVASLSIYQLMMQNVLRLYVMIPMDVFLFGFLFSFFVSFLCHMSVPHHT